MNKESNVNMKIKSRKLLSFLMASVTIFALTPFAATFPKISHQSGSIVKKTVSLQRLNKLGNITPATLGYYLDQKTNNVITIDNYQQFSQFNSGTLTINNNVDEISSNVFSNGTWPANNEQITKIIFENNSIISKIDSGAFKNAFYLQEAYFPDSLTFIGDDAFTWAPLYDIFINSSSKLAFIGDRAFYYAQPSNYLKLNEGLTHIGNQAFYSWEIGYSYTLTIPASVVFIGDQAFYNWGNCLQYTPALTLCFEPNSKLEYIGKSAFFFAGTRGGMNNLTLPEGSGLLKIDDYAFFWANPTTLTIPSNVEYIGDSVFGDADLSDLIIAPNSNLTYIGDQAFYTSHLKNWTWIDGSDFNCKLQHIGSEAFYNANLTTLKIPKTISFIGANAFNNSQIESMLFEGFVRSSPKDIFMDINAFASTPLTSVLNTSWYAFCLKYYPNAFQH